MRIVLFCHVEPGTLRDGELILRPHHEEGIVLAVPRIVSFADRYNIPMTFAMTPTSLKMSDTDLSGHEVGIHLHPWDAVLQQALRSKVAISSDCLANYPAEDQAAMIQAASEIFEETVGRSPHTFVAGRWSESSTTLRLLHDAGFRFDGSPLPGHVSECANWSLIPRLAQPFAPSLENYQGRGSLDFLYIPVYQGLWNHYLTPESIHVLGVSYFKAALKEAKVGGGGTVHMFFHSPMATDSIYLAEFARVVEHAQDDLDANFVLPSALPPSDKPAARPFPPAYLAHMNLRLLKTFGGRGEFGRRLAGPRAFRRKSPTTSIDVDETGEAD